MLYNWVFAPVEDYLLLYMWRLKLYLSTIYPVFFFFFEGMDTVFLKKQDWKKGNCKLIFKLLKTES